MSDQITLKLIEIGDTSLFDLLPFRKSLPGYHKLDPHNIDYTVMAFPPWIPGLGNLRAARGTTYLTYLYCQQYSPLRTETGRIVAEQTIKPFQEVRDRLVRE